LPKRCTSSSKYQHNLQGWSDLNFGAVEWLRAGIVGATTGVTGAGAIVGAMGGLMIRLGLDGGSAEELGTGLVEEGIWTVLDRGRFLGIVGYCV
jgi:hypothetical protein